MTAFKRGALLYGGTTVSAHTSTKLNSAYLRNYCIEAIDATTHRGVEHGSAGNGITHVTTLTFTFGLIVFLYFFFLTRTDCHSKFNWYLPEFHINLPNVNWNRKIQGEQGVLLAITDLIKDQKIDICFLQDRNFEINGEESLLNTNGKRVSLLVTQHRHIAGR